MSTHINLHGLADTTQTSLFNASKKQFYGAEGTGRDTYIYKNNGGFYPAQAACMVEGIGKWQIF